MNSSFSIITPNYIMGNYLEETIESVLDNLQKEDEYFVIDGGSTCASGGGPCINQRCIG